MRSTATLGDELPEFLSRRGGRRVGKTGSVAHGYQPPWPNRLAVTTFYGAGDNAMGLGTWELRSGAQTVSTALGLGYRVIDTSGDYGTQPAIGQALRKSRVPRDEVFLVTKVEETEDGYDATLDRLRELGLDHAAAKNVLRFRRISYAAWIGFSGRRIGMLAPVWLKNPRQGRESSRMLRLRRRSIWVSASRLSG